MVKILLRFSTICTSITDRQPGTEFAEPHYKEQAANLVGEAIRVADALNVRLVGFDFFDPNPYRMAEAGNFDGLAYGCSRPGRDMKYFVPMVSTDIVRLAAACAGICNIASKKANLRQECLRSKNFPTELESRPL